MATTANPSAEPVYLRVLEDLRSRIRSGLLGPGARVPSRNAIITNYHVGETAAKHALQVLLAEGLIEAKPGSGCYVRRSPATAALVRDRPLFPGSPFGLQQVADDDDQAAVTSRRLTWEHQTELLPATPTVAARLGSQAGAMTVTTTYLMRVDGEPVQLAVSFEVAELTAGSPVALPEEGPLAGRGVTERLRSIGIMIDDVTEDVSVRPAMLAEATALGVPPGSPLFVVERAHHSGPRVVEAADVLVPASKFRLRYRFPAAAHNDQAAQRYSTDVDRQGAP